MHQILPHLPTRHMPYFHQYYGNQGARALLFGEAQIAEQIPILCAIIKASILKY